MGSDRCDGGAGATQTGDQDGDDIETTERLMSLSAMRFSKNHTVAPYRMESRIYGAIFQLPPRDDRNHARRQVQTPRYDRRLRAGLGIIYDDFVDREPVLLRELALH